MKSKFKNQTAEIQQNKRCGLGRFTAGFFAVVIGLSSALSSSASETTFDGFTTGASVHYQGPGSTTVTPIPFSYTIPDPYGSLWTVADEWGQSPSLFDEAVVDDGGNIVWRLSDALTGSYSNQPNSPSSPAVAGDSAAFLYNDRGPDHTLPTTPPDTRAGATTPYFHGGFDFKSATGAAQPGLFISVNLIVS
jgi:hypothetical protein